MAAPVRFPYVQLQSSTVLLTGATGGLGRAMAAALAGEGAKLVLSGRRLEALESLADGLDGDGHRALAADLSDAAAGADLVERAGHLDAVIANAGIGGGTAIEDGDYEAIARVVRVNLEVPAAMVAAALPAMIERGSGRFVLVASLAGKAAPGGSALYAATKAGLRAFGIALAKDLHGSGVGVTVLNPGFIRDAGMFADSGRTPPAGMGTATPEEVGDAVVRALRDERGEVDVAPPQQRGFVNLALHLPSLGARLERTAGGSTVVRDIRSRQAR